MIKNTLKTNRNGRLLEKPTMLVIASALKNKKDDKNHKQKMDKNNTQAAVSEIKYDHKIENRSL